MKNQSRRSISVRGDTYAKLRAYCDHERQSMSTVVEKLIADLFRDEELVALGSRGEEYFREQPDERERVGGVVLF